MDGMSKETFKDLPTENKLDVVFDVLVDVHKEIKAVKKNKVHDRTMSIAAGFVGGFSAMVAKFAIWR